MTKEMKRPISNITQDSIKPLLSNAVEFYTNKNREAHKCIQERDEYINYLESKLSNAKPQQALPFVPEFVAEWIEILKTKGLKPLKNPETYGETGFTEEKLQDIVFWISKHQEDYMRAWLDGYTVEKPQLFYLKNKLTTSYLELDKTNDYFHHTMNPAPYYDMTRKSQFTQQEIDSMQTGSYEQIEVAE
ncbi:hypothetical protein UC317_1640 [Lactococcus lactis subsp. lactis]|uniref:DUF1642 domain-containing protein n=1 Tax=Lactococcus lactis TaxID=1358 RepID=UPI00071C89B8|nr:DUF1642 domain-containing protein [Lactococcus lactis]ARE11994.1 DUF1642 domain-containing protein [Lactococcus lactis subsp. lactis]KSU32399.1 hypothetical protein UC317_1640 [Lactococcus lactis subsp. lactis]URL08695.1 DUF1642 domain-containing protein [Lactococcus lactis subsp. lactis]